MHSIQKYASKIQADLVLKEIILDDITQEGNPKRGEVHTEFIGYQPGEIYSFAIAYVFEDGCVSPLYHIPGRNHSLREEHIFRPETELSVKKRELSPPIRLTPNLRSNKV